MQRHQHSNPLPPSFSSPPTPFSPIPLALVVCAIHHRTSRTRTHQEQEGSFSHLVSRVPEWRPAAFENECWIRRTAGRNQRFWSRHRPRLLRRGAPREQLTPQPHPIVELPPCSLAKGLARIDVRHRCSQPHSRTTNNVDGGNEKAEKKKIGGVRTSRRTSGNSIPTRVCRLTTVIPGRSARKAACSLPNAPSRKMEMIT